MDFFSPQTLVPLFVCAIYGWYWLDMRSILKALQRKNQLTIEGRWEDLDNHYKRALKPRRPFVWLYRRYFLPGTVTIQYALFLHEQGRSEEGLLKADQAIREIENKPGIFSSAYRSQTFNTLCSSFRARALILNGLGRHDEARQAIAQLQRLAGEAARPASTLALVEYACGRLDEALEQARAVPEKDAQYESARGIIALAHSMKGEFNEAIQALQFEPRDISKFYTPEGFEAVSKSAEGEKLIELQRKKHMGVFQPARLLQLALVYLESENIENTTQALDEAEKKLGPQPAIQTVYCRLRACSIAALGKADEAESYLERLRTITRKTPKRSLLAETHFAAGRSYLYLGQSDKALSEFLATQQSALHPIEKHRVAYWIAVAHQKAGRAREATQYYQTVAADPIPSWMRKRAAEVLARSGG